MALNAEEVVSMVERLAQQWTEPPLIMVVEDNPSDAEFITRFLTEQGCRISLAKSVHEAEGQVANWKGKEMPQMVLLDLTLPNGDAAEVVKAVREVSKEIPITLLTGYPESYKVDRVLMEGVVSLMHKPITAEKLKELFATHSVCSPPTEAQA